jgi:hypothetical protein
MKKSILFLSLLSLYSITDASDIMPDDFPEWFVKNTGQRITKAEGNWEAFKASYYASQRESSSREEEVISDRNDMSGVSAMNENADGATASRNPKYDADAKTVVGDDDERGEDFDVDNDAAASDDTKYDEATDTKLNEATNLIVELAKLFSDNNRTKIQDAFNDNPYPDNTSKKSRSLGRLGKAKRKKDSSIKNDKKAKKARHAHLKKMKKGTHNPVMQDKKAKRTDVKSQALAVGRYKN